MNKNDEVENFIRKMNHIPFESGVILPMTQLYGGHYGILINIQFHCIISTKEDYAESRDLSSSSYKHV